MSEHSNVISGSVMFRRAHCAASKSLEDRMPKEPPKPYADQGSVYHEAIAEILIAEVGSEDGSLEFELVKGKHYQYDEQFAVTEEGFKQKIWPALGALDDLLLEIDPDDKGVTMLVERRVSLDSQIPGAFGTVDVLLLDSQGRLWVIDWKFGDGVPVPAEDNYQLGFYAGCALYDKNPQIKEVADKAESVVLCIIQPRVGANQLYDYWETTIDWVEDLIDLAEKAVKAYDDPPPPKTGSHCRWCRAKPICPAHNDLATEAITNPPEAGNTVQLAAALDRADRLYDLINETYRLAQHELENGATIPGWKLVNKQPRRYWADPEAAEKAIKRKFGAKESFKRTLLSPNQVEQKDKKFYGHAVRKYVDSKSSGLTIVRDSDPRPAVEPDNEELRRLLEETVKQQAAGGESQ